MALEERPEAVVGLRAPGPGVAGPGVVVVEAAGEEVKEALRLPGLLRHALAGRLLRLRDGGLFRGVRGRFRRCCRCQSGVLPPAPGPRSVPGLLPVPSAAAGATAGASATAGVAAGAGAAVGATAGAAAGARAAVGATAGAAVGATFAAAFAAAFCAAFDAAGAVTGAAATVVEAGRLAATEDDATALARAANASGEYCRTGAGGGWFLASEGSTNEWKPTAQTAYTARQPPTVSRMDGRRC